MEDKALYNVAKNTNKIFMSDFVIDAEEPDWSASWGTCLRTEKQFDELFKNIGFEIKNKTIHPHEAWYKNAEYWLNRINKNNITSGYQMMELEKFCSFILGGLFKSRKISIIDIYAERV